MKYSNNIKRKSIYMFSLLFLLVFVSFVTFKHFFNADVISDPDTRIFFSGVDNKEYGMPYINPEWVEYNRLSDEEKANVTEVPAKYIYDYIPVSNLYGTYAALPSRYNLRDEYATPIYDQGEDGLCWAYSTATMMESNLKVTKGITTRFSPNHMAFVTASPSYYNDNYNVYTEDRIIGDGINAKYYFGFDRFMLSSGVIPATNHKEDIYEDDFDISRKYDYADIYNVNNFDYTVTDAVNFPIYENNEDYRNMLKSFIKNYGAVRIYMSWSNRDSYYNDEMSLHFDYDTYGSGHAVVLVGWDDNYTYRDHKGAWIIQNSYSKSEGDRMFYLSYDIDPVGIREITGIINMDERNWDNVYNFTNYPKVEFNGFKINQDIQLMTSSMHETSTTLSNNPVAIMGTAHFTYTKNKAKVEQLKMISIVTANQGGTFQVFVSPDGNKDNYIFLDNVTNNLPGIYSVKVSDNILLNSDNFSIKVVSSDGVFYQYVTAYTSIVEEKTSSSEVHSVATLLNKNNAGNYVYKLTTFIPEGYDNGELSYSITAFNRKTDTNQTLLNRKYNSYYNGNAEILYSVPYDLPIGTKINVKITGKNNQVIDTFSFNYDIDVYNGNMQGSGTEDDPYMVSTIEQLRLISAIPSAYYKLANDIDLSLATVDEREEIYYFGWMSLDGFGGVLDGDGHSIKNITTLSDTSDYLGIFKSLKGATIKNLIIENFSSSGASIETPTGALAKEAENVKIENVVFSGNLNSRTLNLIGSGSEIIINGLSMYVNVDNDSYVHKLIYDPSSTKTNQVNNLSIISNKRIDVSELSSLRNAYFIATDAYNYGINNMFGNISYLENVYIYSSATSQNSEIHPFTNISDFSSLSLSEINFSDNVWNKISDNSLPVLKAHNTVGVSEISGTPEYNINIGEKKKINYSILTPNAFYKNVEFSIDDTDIADVVDGYVIGKGEGTTILHIKSTDGSEVIFDVTINVDNKIICYFDYGDRIDTLKVDYGEEITMPTESGNDKIIIGWLENGINKYNVGFKKNVYTSKEYVALYSDDILANSIYTYDKDKKIIKSICLVDVDTFINGLNIPNNYTAKIFNNDEEVTSGNIITDSITRIYNGDTLVVEYTNSVIGDVYKDGNINSRDAGLIIQYLVGMRELDDAQLYAADFSRDNQIRLNDVELIKHYVVHEYEYYERMCPNEG